MSAAFQVGDQVCIVGNYHPMVITTTGTVTQVSPGETYDVWARFGEHDYPFRADELAPAQDVEGAWVLATATEPIPTVTVGRRWSNPGHLATMLGLGLVLGVITGVLAAPVQTVEVRTTVTHAVPPVCAAEARASSIEREFAKERIRASNDAITHGNLADAAGNLGHVDERLTERDIANQAELDRDAAEFARIGAAQSAEENAQACLTWTVPQRSVERIAQ